MHSAVQLASTVSELSSKHSGHFWSIFLTAFVPLLIGFTAPSYCPNPLMPLNVQQAKKGQLKAPSSGAREHYQLRL